ncbi:MAG: C25 family cysteine peptidase [Ferruginibacter sp.]
MKKLLFPFFIMCTLAGTAQYNNNWIDYNKTYYKFKVAKDGLYRIGQAALSSINLGTIPAEQFQLWRNGEQVRLYTSIAAGPLGSNDYIEFQGKMNDGIPDKPLYRIADNQLCDSFSLHTDTATYFLTVNAAATNLRYSNGTNNVSGNTLSPEPYFMRRVEQPYKQMYNRGFANLVGEYVYSSSYDAGEGWTTGDIAPCCPLSQIFTGLNVYTAGPANSVSFYIAAFGNAALNAQFTRNLQVKLNNTLVIDTALNNFTVLRKQLNNLPLSYLQSPDNMTVTVVGVNAPLNGNDRIVVGTMAVTYPAKFNFNNSANFYFELAPSAAGNYLEIDNFNVGGVQPVLYSINDGRRYLGDIAVAGKVRFALPASPGPVRKFILVNQGLSNINTVSSFTPKTFINYNTASNQGDYLIITNPSLFNDGNGNNYVDQYRAYRASSIGGGYNVKVISIDELTDQFAFGIKKHPAAIRDFIRLASQQFNLKPKYIFLVGRGMGSIDFKNNENSPNIEKLDLVPTFGWPASDILLAAEPGQVVQVVPIGRLSVINGAEIKLYLDKVKQYEAAQVSTSHTVADKGWMKNFIHAAGGITAEENADFTYYLNGYGAIAKDTSLGAKVETFQKESSSQVVQANGERIEQLINEGTGFIQYFGHSSANTLAFNLDVPENYSNSGKYPFFNVSGCSAGDNYIYDPTRLNGNTSLSEKWVLADQRGSIGFLASTHLGIPPFLNFYNTKLYQAFSRTLYGNTIGNQMKYVNQSLGANPQSLDFYTRIHLEQLNLNGDPAIKINAFALPDYAIEDQLIKLSPSIITVADNSFNIKAKILNLGKAVGDSIRITVKRLLANDTLQVIYDKLVPGIYYADSLDLTILINNVTDKGLNKLIFTVDADNKVTESSETNNSFTKEFTIFEDEIRPAFPYNFSIVNQQNTRFVASTANPLSVVRQYLMELDTTELFNSPFKKQYNASGIGGAIEFSPSSITYKDSTVYYWRTSIVPLNNGQQIWNTFSFVYLANGSTGFNQSHYFQHQKSIYSSTISLDPDRLFHFTKAPHNLVINTGLFPFLKDDKINVNLDFERLEYYGCVYNSLQFMVFDTTTLEPWKNYNDASGHGRFGSNPVCTAPTRNFFEFSYQDPVSRKHAIDFIDSIPGGLFVSITNLGVAPNTAFIPVNNTFINDWKADQATLGTGNSLYHKLRSIGFNTIDSFYHNLPFSYFYRKNVSTYTPSQIMGPAQDSYVRNIIPLVTTYNSGTIESPSFGPAKKWNSLHWRGKTLDAGAGDTVQIQVYGIKANGTQSLVATVSPGTDTTLAFIDAAVYPFVKLKMLNKDGNFKTPNQLNYWRINADYVPEGAVAPNILFSMPDSVDQGEKINFSLAFKNISPVAFDSLTIKFTITDRSNVLHSIAIPKKKALVSGDTLVVSYSIDTKDYPGINTLYVMVNPDNNQPEQYLYNNFIYKNFFVKEDKFNPLLDITFDGVHILNKDIVASRPHILVKLKDESKFLLLSDTASLKVQVHYPEDATDVYRNFYFGDNMRFIPATTGADNTASIEFSPFFPEDGEYELKISGKDMVGNKAGNIEYKVTFNVLNTPMISNMLNYPNPFTTSTAFVFTLTGSEVPQNMRIQILTITGKIVREITKAELGDIHIGRNITEFKWDGTDMYGQKLGNGVYLYRVLTNLNGKSLDKYKSDGDQTDKFFNKGYGKMYLMR